MSNTEQFRVTAEYLREQGLSPTFPARFFAKVKITESCWLWMGSKSKLGYGRIFARKQIGSRISINMNANRASWIIHFGPVPDEMDVCHDCPDGDNPSCVNPAHLWLGNRSENMKDAVNKWGFNRGNRNGQCTLSQEDVLSIRQMYATGKWTYAAIGRHFGIKDRTVWKIVARIRWMHI